MNVLSLFDGMSCGQIALKRLGIRCNYYASEIDKAAIKETQANFPDTIQVGDVTKLKGDDLPEIDLLMGGSPCQGFSSYGHRLNFDDPRSKLFFEFVRIMRETKPKRVLLENVVMKQEFQDIISEYLGFTPMLINSELVSAQKRPRLYWGNAPFTIPEDKGIELVSILEDDEYPRCGDIVIRRLNERNKRTEDPKYPYVRCLEVRSTNLNKSYCLLTRPDRSPLTNLPVGRYRFSKELPMRKLSVVECCRLQTVDEDYFKVSTKSQKYKMLGNGWTVDVIVHILRELLCLGC